MMRILDARCETNEFQLQSLGFKKIIKSQYAGRTKNILLMKRIFDDTQTFNNLI